MNSFEKLRILIIDDLKEARLMLRTMLSDIGILQVYEAQDGREGLDFIDIADDMIDIIICDWNMPRMNGVELLRQIRSVNPQIPFLMLTGRNDIHSVQDAKFAGVTAYISKPFSMTQLEDKLHLIHRRINGRLTPGRWPGAA